MIDAQLASYATVRQLEYIEALNKAGTQKGAARLLGISDATLRESMAALKKKAASKGWAPEHSMTHTAAPGFAIRRISTAHGPDGIPIQWVIQEPDRAQQEQIFMEAIHVLAQDVSGKAPKIKLPARVAEDLLCAIPVGDPHFGLYTWAKECGDDFDTDIARKLSIGAADRLVASAPACGIGILLLLGDITHANDQTNATPGHKHQLDVDSRFVRVIGIAIETWRHIILRMLEKHGLVIGKLLPGNHDPQAVWALAYALSAYFCNDPRVQIDLGPSKFWYYSFGKVLIGSTHGDTVKPERLPGIMAADRPQEWGAALHRYWYTGHIHSKNAIEFPGVQWESFRTLAAPDAFAAGHGYRAGRDMVAIVHHREYGEVERHRCDVGMVA